ncbi:hypothetical protein [Devosia chinhatensis]|uniref:Curlin n=1 Tax=Devosia chinhatensis TaxID=429727 RepID=A0A0F5FMV7_9HYPH|nr:hypothetical protein [Devosia chinhatensis]KKB09910.1 hypothetical protein VE26_08805 [Devosia chinhatensis]
MTRTCRTIAGLFLALGLSTLPAMAGGQISFGFTPANPDQARTLSTGLQIYSLVRGISSGAYAEQNGSGNAAGIAQQGRNNRGIIIQDGNGHTGIIEQNGNNNSCGLFQFGTRTNAQCLQSGNGLSGITTVFGF